MPPSTSRAALIFDLDGTLLKSDALHLEVFAEIFAAHGAELRDGDYERHIHGRNNEKIFGHFLPDLDWRTLSDEKESRFRARLAGRTPPMPGLDALLDRAAASGWALAVVTNAPRVNATAMLSAIGCRDRFPVVIAEGDTERGKPAPDPYLLALARLRLPARRALVFEDSPPGIAAAAAAGLFTVGLRSTLNEAPLREAGAAMTIADYTDPALATALARLSGDTP